MKPTPETQKPVSTAKAAFFFGTGTLSSRILGLIRDALVLSLMPLDMKDAWFAALRLPNFFRRLLGEGALSSSFIPVYVELRKSNKEADLKVLVNGVFTLLLSVVSLICVVAFLFMDTIIGLWLSGPGFTGVPGKIEMTVTMAKIMVFFLFFISLFAYFMAILNSEKKFTLTGYAPLFLNFGIIGGLLLFKDSPSFVEASAWAVLVGVASQALVLAPAVFRLTGLPKLALAVRHPSVQKVLVKFMPTFIGVGVLQILGLVNTYFASRLMPGALTHIHVADRLLELPLSLIAVSIGTTLLPTLTGLWAENKKEAFTGSLTKHLSLFYFLALPSAFGLWFIGIDIVDILFKRGEFTGPEVLIVGAILKIYCVTLLAAGSLKILNQGLYAIGDTLSPALIALGGLTLHLLMAPWLMDLYQLNGLILSTALVTVFNSIVCVVVLQMKTGLLDWKKILSHFFTCLGASCIMGFYLVSLADLNWKQGRFLIDFPILLILIGFAGLIYFGAGYFLKVEELSLLVKRLKRK